MKISDRIINAMIENALVVTVEHNCDRAAELATEALRQRHPEEWDELCAEFYAKIARGES